MDDVDDVFSIYSRPEVMQFYTEGPHTNPDAAVALIHYFLSLYRAESLIWWGIAQHTSPRLIGMLGLYRLDLIQGTAETGFDLHPDFWGQGLMSEALPAVLRYGFQALQLRRIRANTLPGNKRSQRVLVRCGFRDCGLLGPEALANPLGVDVQHYELLRTDYDGQ